MPTTSFTAFVLNANNSSQNPVKQPVTAADCNIGLMMFHHFFYGKKEM
jgi:hypothetical protein